MVSEVESPVTQEEIDALKQQLLDKTLNDPQALADLKTKNAAVLTVTMPIMMSEMINEIAGGEGKEGKANWARKVLAEAVGFELPTSVEKTKKTTNKRQVELNQKAQRAMVADVIARARAGQISL